MVETDKKVVLKTIGDLTNGQIKFYIDSYQRGYRWTDEQVKEMLLDIYEFSQKHSKESNQFYCLQPIIVTHNSELDEWKVIDGQQRLTTIFLLISYLRGFLPGDSRRYTIRYNNKPKLTECLTCISKHAENRSWSDEVCKELNAYYGDDIDCYYVIEAYNTINMGLYKLRPDVDANQWESFMDFTKSVFGKTKVIWYDLEAKTLEDETSSFRKVNMGKIPLTNAELIKALLLRKDTNDSEKTENYKKNLAAFWDTMEQQLSDNRFWHFLTNSPENEYPNRIDFVFDVISENINEEWKNNDDPEDDRFIVNRLINKNYFSFHVFYRYIEQIGNANYVEVIWNEVEEYFRMFKDWYQSKQWYHIIGYLVCASGERYLETICSISKLYMNQKEGKKSAFVNSLNKKIANSLHKGKPISTVPELKEFLVDLNYTKNPKDIDRFLLLYNIASTASVKNEYSRFPFYAYKGEGILWSIEHINPQREDIPKNDNERKEWLNKLFESIDELVPSDEKRKDDLDGLKEQIKMAHQLAEKNAPLDPEALIKLYESVIDVLDEDHGTDNSIKNLVLLDRNTNSLFSNSIFPVKRRLLIEAYKSSDTFIPVCTRNVFFKAFPESKELLKWNQNDKEDYLDNIVTSIAGYLKLQEE